MFDWICNKGLKNDDGLRRHGFLSDISGLISLIEVLKGKLHSRSCHGVNICHFIVHVHCSEDQVDCQNMELLKSKS